MPDRLRCFVIMSYSSTSDAVFERVILPAIRDLRDTPVLVLRADQMNRELTLKAHVESAVESADFCIADLTDANPNVMYELGYATAKQKPVLLIQEASSRRHLPSDLSGLSLTTYDRNHVGESRRMLVLAVERVIKSIGTGGRRGGGVFSAELLSEPGVFERFAASVRYSLSALVSTPAILVQEVLPRIDLTSRPELLIRIICADPEGEFARVRADHLAVPVAQYRARLWAELRELRALLGERSKPRTELRLTSDMVATSLLLSDDVALVFPYLAIGASRDAAGIEIIRDRAPKEFDVFRQQFGMAWAAHKSINIAETPPRE